MLEVIPRGERTVRRGVGEGGIAQPTSPFEGALQFFFSFFFFGFLAWIGFVYSEGLTRTALGQG